MEGQITAYFNDLLRREKVEGAVRKRLHELTMDFASFFAKHIKEPVKVFSGGSYYKKIELKRKYDLDIIVQLGRQPTKSVTPLKTHFYTVKSVLNQKQQELNVSNFKLKRSALGCDYNGQGHQISLDFIPAQESDGEHTYIFNKHTEKRIRTNLALQKRTIDELAARDVLKLLKCWKLKNNIRIPSYVMEIIGCQILRTTPCENFRKQPLFDTMTEIFLQIKSSIMTRKIIDLGNPNNHIDKNWRGFEKMREKMQQVATRTYEALNNQQLTEIKAFFE